MEDSTLYDSSLTDFPGVGYPSCSRELSRVAPNTRDPNKFYAFLGIAPNASENEIRRAVRKRYRQYHPDGWEPSPEKFERTKWISKILLTHQTRTLYHQTPEGYHFREPSDRDESILREITLEVDEEPRTLYHFYAFNYQEGDELVAQWWYKFLVQVAPIFSFSSRVKVVLSDDKQPFWIESANMFVIPRWWFPSSANAFALFSVLTKKTSVPL